MEYQTKYQGPWIDIDEDSKLAIRVCEWRYQKPVVKTNKCCHCGTCYIFCPTGCVNSNDSYFFADLEYCKGCGICARVCPVSAIKMVLEGKE
ncbi:MAG: 4Fe-4S binding protein [Deltaproteobacteria bacterium]|nr:4Fe-4S binding protein [Deltaproteobacteria bacterium]